MALAILRNLSSSGNLSVLSLSLSVKDCLFFFLGGASVIIARFILPEAVGSNKNSQICQIDTHLLHVASHHCCGRAKFENNGLSVRAKRSFFLPITQVTAFALSERMCRHHTKASHEVASRKFNVFIDLFIC